MSRFPKLTQVTALSHSNQLLTRVTLISMVSPNQIDGVLYQNCHYLKL